MCLSALCSFEPLRRTLAATKAWPAGTGYVQGEHPTGADDLRQWPRPSP
jgi:hypothetical protein